MRRVMLGSGILGFACAVVCGQAVPESNLVFEAASVKPHVDGAPGSTGRTGIEEDASQIHIENLPLRVLIAISYGVKGSEQLSGPSWLNSTTFDILAKPPAGYKREQLQYLLRNLLAERFRLTVHHEAKLISAFALVVAKGGPKLHESADPRTYHTGRPGLVEGKQMSTDELAGLLTNLLGQPVTHHTGLSPMFDVHLEWTPESPLPTGADAGTTPEAGPSLFTALQEQLGLRLESQKIPADVVVADACDGFSGRGLFHSFLSCHCRGLG
jgi:uncharacterized protein (TIGR03435 family)